MLHRIFWLIVYGNILKCEPFYYHLTYNVLTKSIMRKLVLFFALASTVVFTSCSKDEDDTDAIVGTWLSDSSITLDGASTMTYEDQWVFKSDLSGEYKEMTNDEVDFETTFTWMKSEDSYIVIYADDEGTDTFTISQQAGYTTLQDGEEIVALKE